MAYVSTTLPLTGAGDPTAAVAVDNIGGALYQAMKIFSAEEGSTLAVVARSSAPSSGDVGLVVRPITSTDSVMAVVGAVALTSEGSTRLAGRFTIDNPTTSVTLNGSVTIGNPTTAVDLASGGSTREIGTVNQGTAAGSSASAWWVRTVTTGSVGSTAVNLATGTTGIMGAFYLATGTTGTLGAVGLLAGSSANMLGAVAQGAGSTTVSPWYVYSTGGGGGSTTVDANLTSAGSTKVVGTVGVSSGVILGPSTAAVGLISSGTQTIGSVQLTSAGTTGSIGSVALLAGSSGNTLGAVAQAPGSTSVAPWYVISTAATGGPGSSAVDANLTSLGSTKVVGTVGLSSGTQTIGSVQLTSAGTTGSIGSVALLAGSSANMLGAITQGTPGGSSADAWWVRTVTTGAAGAGSTTVDANLTSAGSTKIVGIVDGQPFSSANVTFSTVNSSAEAQLFAANASRKAVSITNLATAVSLFVGMSTAAVSTAGANAHLVIPALQTRTFAGQIGDLPLYTGPLRVRVVSTTVAGPVVGVQFT